MTISRSNIGSQLKGNKMPLTKKGKKIMRSMKGQYGDKRGERVFYASKNKGKLKGVEKAADGGQMQLDQQKISKLLQAAQGQQSPSSSMAMPQMARLYGGGAVKKKRDGIAIKGKTRGKYC